MRATVHFVVRSWIRQALRASGVAILVPAAIAVAIALSVIGGGHNFSSLGEVLRGPAAPPAEAAAPPVHPRGRTPELHVQLRGQTPQLQRHVAVSRRPAPLRRSARKPSPERPTPHRPAPQQPSPAPPAPAQPSPTLPPPAPEPHPIHDTATAVADTLRPLPLAGPAAADAVEAVVSLVDPA